MIPGDFFAVRMERRGVVRVHLIKTTEPGPPWATACGRQAPRRERLATESEVTDACRHCLLAIARSQFDVTKRDGVADTNRTLRWLQSLLVRTEPEAMRDDLYVLEGRRRIFHRVSRRQTAPPFISRCGRAFPVLITALAETVGDDVEHCQQCARAVAPQKKFTVTHR